MAYSPINFTSLLDVKYSLICFDMLAYMRCKTKYATTTVEKIRIPDFCHLACGICEQSTDKGKILKEEIRKDIVRNNNNFNTYNNSDQVLDYFQLERYTTERVIQSGK